MDLRSILCAPQIELTFHRSQNFHLSCFRIFPEWIRNLSRQFTVYANEMEPPHKWYVCRIYNVHVCVQLSQNKRVPMNRVCPMQL